MFSRHTPDQIKKTIENITSELLEKEEYALWAVAFSSALDYFLADYVNLEEEKTIQGLIQVIQLCPPEIIASFVEQLPYFAYSISVHLIPSQIGEDHYPQFSQN